MSTTCPECLMIHGWMASEDNDSGCSAGEEPVYPYPGGSSASRHQDVQVTEEGLSSTPLLQDARSCRLTGNVRVNASANAIAIESKIPPRDGYDLNLGKTSYLYQSAFDEPEVGPLVTKSAQVESSCDPVVCLLSVVCCVVCVFVYLLSVTNLQRDRVCPSVSHSPTIGIPTSVAYWGGDVTMDFLREHP
ncbi:hypothetical protein J6590_015344 [Homalodisca vitripennis]|nr:hypothetical protein J6590_015344 [Homalodisca vitripennis]